MVNNILASLAFGDMPLAHLIIKVFVLYVWEGV